MSSTRWTLLIVASLITLVVPGPAAWVVAQDGTPGAAGVHPIVGTWLLTPVSDEEPPTLATFHQDGTAIEIVPGGSTGVGAWMATGPSSVTLTLRYHEVGPEGFAGAAILRASIEVAADGNTFTATFTGEFILPDGTASGQYGPGTGTGERIVPEAPGEPVGPFEALFGEEGGEEEGEATPAG